MPEEGLQTYLDRDHKPMDECTCQAALQDSEDVSAAHSRHCGLRISVEGIEAKQTYLAGNAPHGKMISLRTSGAEDTRSVAREVEEIQPCLHILNAEDTGFVVHETEVKRTYLAGNAPHDKRISPRTSGAEDTHSVAREVEEIQPYLDGSGSHGQTLCQMAQEIDVR
jgi:hypothetical protein